MAGETIVTNSAFAKYSGNTISNSTLVTNYAQRFGRGNRAYAYVTPRSNIFTDDSVRLTIYYYSSGWVQSNRIDATADGTTKAITCSSSHSHRTRWYFLFDGRPFADGKFYATCYSRVYSAYYIHHSSYPKGKHLKMYKITNFGVSTSNTAATSSAGSNITTGQYICTKYQ